MGVTLKYREEKETTPPANYRRTILWIDWVILLALGLLAVLVVLMLA